MKESYPQYVKNRSAKIYLAGIVIFSGIILTIVFLGSLNFS
jgi:hypothetical protein